MLRVILAVTKANAYQRGRTWRIVLPIPVEACVVTGVLVKE
jgi:hypothetical protein